MPAAARIAAEPTLRLSRSPTSELAAVALHAQQAAGYTSAEGCDFIVVAVEAGAASDELGAELEALANAGIERAARRTAERRASNRRAR